MNRPLLLAALLFTTARLLAFDVQTMVQHATCANATGSIMAYPSGGTWPYTYLWSNGATTNVISNVLPGTYSVTVTDADNETGFAEVELIATTALFPPSGPGVDIWSCDAGCAGDFDHYSFPLNGVQPYTVTTDPVGPVSSAGQNYLSVNGMCLNTPYLVTVTDAEGCSGIFGPVTLIEQPGPNMLSWSATPSCPDGATGSLTAQYDDIDSLYISGPGVYFMPTTNPFTLTNLPPGQYFLQSVLVQDDLPYGIHPSSCYHEDMIEVPVTTDPCGSLDGVVYAEIDGNCVQDVGDPGLAYRVLSVEPGAHLVMTASDGTYSTQFFYDSYTLDASIPDFSSNCTALPAPFILDAGNTSAIIDLPMTPDFGADLAVSVHLLGAVPGFPHLESVHLNNDGPYTFASVVIDLYCDPILVYTSANLAPDLVEAGHLQWVLGNVGPFSEVNLELEFLVPADPQLVGHVLTSDVTLTLDTPDSNPANDADQASHTITSSFDPNDKVAETSSRLSSSAYYIDEDQYVDYTIRFQNTGTGPAYNVVLMDTISPLLDLTTFTNLAASHDFEASLVDPRVLRFSFPYIMLPDSGSDMAGSQGFLSFRLRPVSNLAVGQQLVNAADIYFDFNAPVHTNDAVLTVEESTGLPEAAASALVVYPNPVVDVLRIDLPGSAARVDVIGADGRHVLGMRTTPGTNQVDTRAMMPGAYSIRVQYADGTFQHARFVKR